MRWAALVCAGTLALVPPSAVVREHPELARLTEELTARSEPGFWGETEGPLVRDRLLVLWEPAAREHAAWAAGFLKRVAAIAPDELSHEDWITWRLLRWEGEMAAGRGDVFWYDVPITPYASQLRTIGTGFASAGLASAEERLRYRDGLHQLAVLDALGSEDGDHLSGRRRVTGYRSAAVAAWIAAVSARRRSA